MPEPFCIASQIQAHTLANSIISRHQTNHAILGAPELVLLRQFCIDPSVSKRDAILAEHAMVDEPGARPGKKAAESKGSLVGLMIARYGTHDPALEDWEWEMLREWFDGTVPTTQET
ncbi:hypothetical protein LTR91_010595 [Friedmanniomyces endolithicus]|uniref:Uncharacterized protein n=1 Tax=Friedmanniomyces endolithicus TaxID=329885 RepID=A0AAN6KIT1_9PEZI|nr:hypothetical protein LTS00_017846 [Friedmanniomyces endolithicus]KAK0822950.1 hypothetical protein LTR73_008915 [Friedmanniomyces endolithicus]KAK0901626.1 hypothetical protein LTR57_020072 [Friedmanniomyces endolithicus]KAK0930071.1 hypothetical protein LTR29_016820 [Friedmanniomyces endolithicus]KAK0955620.1 hypothetical protein LTS01_023273 [Friedmanniomyces endolithicus]